jgi:hypothetical protein
MLCSALEAVGPLFSVIDGRTSNPGITYTRGQTRLSYEAILQPQALSPARKNVLMEIRDNRQTMPPRTLLATIFTLRNDRIFSKLWVMFRPCKLCDTEGTARQVHAWIPVAPASCLANYEVVRKTPSVQLGRRALLVLRTSAVV